METKSADVKRLTPQNWKCFFGYYEKSALSKDGRHLLFHRVQFQDRVPEKDDCSEIYLMEMSSGKIRKIGDTYAWNFQQGAMLQWLPGGKALYNVRVKDKFCAEIYETKTGRKNIVTHPVSAVSRDGRFALSINFARLARHRPGYGYEGLPDEFADAKWPGNDGIYIIDIQSGKCELIIPLESLLKFRQEEGIREQFAWFNHTLFSPDGKKFVFLNRWRHEQRHRTAMFISDIYGEKVKDLLDTYLISHFDWKNNTELVVWAEIDGKRGFFIVNAGNGESYPVPGNIQEGDGHCSFSSDERFILLDTYPIDKHRKLSVFNMKTCRQAELGKFYSPPEITGPFRCDLHPRWSFSGEDITFDSAHEGNRAVYAVNLTEWKEN